MGTRRRHTPEYRRDVAYPVRSGVRWCACGRTGGRGIDAPPGPERFTCAPASEQAWWASPSDL